MLETSEKRSLSASIEVQLRLKTNLLVTGHYKMKGHALGGIVNINSTDTFKIVADQLSLSGRALFRANKTVSV